MYGGGGIMPDIFVPIDTSYYQPAINQLLLNGGFNSFVYNYYLQHRTELEKYPTVEQFIRGFNRTEEMWQGLMNYARKDSINLDQVMGNEKTSLEKRLKALLARFKWRNTGLYEVLNSDDPAIKRAVEEIKKSPSR